MKTITHWKDFFSFIKNPKNEQIEGTKNKSLLTLNSLLLKLLFIPVLMLILYLTGSVNGIIKGGTLHQNVEQLYNPILLYTMVAILEEFAFRGALTKFNPVLFATSLTGMIVLYTKKLVFHNMFFESEGLLEIGILAGILFPIFYFIGKKFEKPLTTFWEKNFALLVYISAILFAIPHFLNSATLDISYLKTILSQLLGGFVLAFVRVRSGLVYAIILHFVYNIIL